VELDEFKVEWPLKDVGNINLAKVVMRQAAKAGQLVDKDGWLDIGQLVTMLKGATKKRVTKSDVVDMAELHPELFEMGGE
jgi:hypothetical protein